MRAFDEIPRPAHHPVLGHLPEWVGPRNATRVLHTLLDYAQECGPLARVPFGPIKLLLVSDADLAHTLLAHKDANVKGWPYILTRAVLDNVLLLNGEAWSRHRAVYRRALGAADITWAHRPLPSFLAALAKERAIDLGESVQQLVADCVCELLCSTRFDRSLEPHRARVQYELAGIGIDLQCQPWSYLSVSRWVNMRRSVAAMREFFRAHVRARLREKSEAPDVLNGFLRVAETGVFSREVGPLTDGMVNFFFTAHDVLSSSASWCLYLLARHPDVQAQIRRGEPGALHRAVRESLRLHPGYPLFSRRTAEPIELGGHRIGSGVDVVVSPWVIHRLPRHWPEPERFDPERWRDVAARPTPIPSGPYLPFGGGYRSCIAFALAFPLLEALVAAIVERFELTAVPGHEPEIAYWGSTSSANGLPCTIVTVSSDELKPRGRCSPSR